MTRNICKGQVQQHFESGPKTNPHQHEFLRTQSNDLVKSTVLLLYLTH